MNNKCARSSHWESKGVCNLHYPTLASFDVFRMDRSHAAGLFITISTASHDTKSEVLDDSTCLADIV